MHCRVYCRKAVPRPSKLFECSEDRRDSYIPHQLMSPIARNCTDIGKVQSGIRQMRRIVCRYCSDVLSPLCQHIDQFRGTGRVHTPSRRMGICRHLTVGSRACIRKCQVDMPFQRHLRIVRRFGKDPTDVQCSDIVHCCRAELGPDMAGGNTAMSSIRAH
jgi:hypothetical protein